MGCNVGIGGNCTVRSLGKLSSLKVSKTSKPGHYGDGGGLWLQVSGAGAKSWVFRFTRGSRTREMGLGGVHTIGLAEAREAAHKARQQVHEGIDPIEARKVARQEAERDNGPKMTFEQCAERFVDAHRAGWRNAKHGDQWVSTLKRFAYPEFDGRDVAKIDTALVMRCLEPIWRSKTETASRVRGRIEQVLDWATVHGYRQGENPARWRGHLDKLLPARRKTQRVEHHAALPYGEVGAFMKQLRTAPGIGARAFEFAILTASRTGEVIGARWSEIDKGAATWTIPGSRMKAGREHRIPLSDRCLKILAEMREHNSDYVFPSARGVERPLSNMAFLMQLRRMERGDLTAHGFRSTFRDWCAEATNYPHEMAEMALAHTIGDKVEAAYRRGDLREKRRSLMTDWAAYCDGAAGQGANIAAAA
jgi:integrase